MTHNTIWAGVWLLIALAILVVEIRTGKDHNLAYWSCIIISTIWSAAG